MIFLAIQKSGGKEEAISLTEATIQSNSGNNDDRNNGVGFICTKRIANCVLGYNQVSDRIMTLRVQGHPINITIIQAYAPTSTAKEEVIVFMNSYKTY